MGLVCAIPVVVFLLLITYLLRESSDVDSSVSQEDDYGEFVEDMILFDMLFPDEK